MMYIYFKAPFGAFRHFKSVEMAITAEFITHSAAYGLLLGLAGVDRQDKHKFVGARVAIGAISSPGRNEARLPKVGRTYQQLIQGRRVLDEDKGGNFKLRPFWREVLCNLEGYIGLEHSELEKLVRQGIEEPSMLDYWGLPFMGDNNFFVERLDVREKPEPCCWFYPYDGESLHGGKQLHYLTVWTDYETNIQSKGLLFALSEVKDFLNEDDKAWVRIKESRSDDGSELGGS